MGKAANWSSRVFTSRAKLLQLDMERFFSMIDQGALLLTEAIGKYLDKAYSDFESRVMAIDELEHQADSLRRQIKHRLYVEMLIPDSRGDVLALIETLDNVLDSIKHVTTNFSIEKPWILDCLVTDFRDLSATSTKAVLEVTLAARAFFSELYRVTEHLDKVHFYEHQADQIEDGIKRKAFASEEIGEFSKRVHLRYFAERLSLVADESEAVAERLAVYAIKRSI